MSCSVLNKASIMASKPILCGDCIMEVSFNKDSETNSSESSDNERPESPEIALIIDITDEATPETWPSYYPPLLPFTANAGPNTDIQNTDVMSFVNLFITNNFLEYVCYQFNLYASPVISATPGSFTKHSQFQT
jgi:hypothetical protein